MAFHIGFTGTRHGMTPHQINSVCTLIAEAKLAEKVVYARHGDCIGADETFDQLCAGMCIPRIVHPPDVDTYRAFCAGELILEARPYLFRNRDIVNNSGVLIATPETHTERDRSGTWSTVRYARRTNKPHVVVYPCGSYDGSTTPTQRKELPWAGSSLL